MDHKSPEAFRTISEVAEWLGVPTHVLRFWESRFSQVKPVKRAGGRRYYRPADMELLGGIRKLLHEDGMTIRGVQKLLREKGVRHVAEMSPPLDLGAESKDVTPDNVVELSDRRETGAEPEKAQSAETSGAGGEDEDAPWYDSGIFAEAPKPQPGTADSPDTGDAERAPETATEPPTAEPRRAPAGSDTTGDGPPPVDPGDPMPDPVTMDFLAHDATPDGGEPEAPARDAPAPADPAQTDPADPMSSPDALDFSAHDAQPETHESGPAAATADEDAEPEARPAASVPPPDPGTAPVDAEGAAGGSEPAAPEAAEDTPDPDAGRPVQPAAAGPEPTSRPALVMPEIAADPADDGPAPEGPRMATRIRDLRTARTVVPTSSLRALADRLEEIARRMNENGSPPNGF
ncbi:MerR family transcriptional regulator [Maritimibacter sp. HL-12]|uniref:MerR family transcriptional regulator n=1 Tax=Maritimibacter sp. HL-12 TaxID=1162418 RepID=UPI000A0F2856|nr:MerR family transcriptional regulator [Maritimibacter sp. HL-12]SMH30249.1 DNA-binding transcriptional regulator, MerR family [Maritimibacter sp. HL-12]